MRLHLEAHLADFVQEDGALMRELQAPDLVAIGAGEAAFRVTEELGPQQAFGDRTAVDGDEGPMRARRVRVDELRDQIFADAALARNQHLGVAGGGARRQRVNLAHRVTGADDERAVHCGISTKRERSSRCLCHNRPLTAIRDLADAAKPNDKFRN